MCDAYRENASRTVLTEKVQSCVRAIQDEACTSAFDVAHVEACRKNVLCRE